MSMVCHQRIERILEQLGVKERPIVADIMRHVFGVGAWATLVAILCMTGRSGGQTRPPVDGPVRQTPVKAADEAPAAIDDSGRLSWVSRDATYEVSSTYSSAEITLTASAGLLTGWDPLRPPWGGTGDPFAFHTNSEAKPYIIITLARVSPVQRLFIQNRGGRAVHDRATGLTVWVSEDKKSWQHVWTAGRVAPSWMVKLKTPVEARYVKIGLLKPNFLHLALVKIYGPSGDPPILTRLAKTDRILLKNGKVLLGTIENKAYTVTAFFGKIEIPASRVAGILAGRDKLARMLLVQADGQVITAAPGGQSVQLKLTTGSTRTVPLTTIRQLGYRISKARPASVPTPERAVYLRGGDRLIWAGCRQKLQLATTWGTIDLPLESLRYIRPVDKEERVHRVKLRGQTAFSGTLLPDAITLKLALGPTATIRPRDFMRLTTGVKPSAPTDTTAMVLRTGERLLGKLDHKTLTVRTEFGRVKLSPVNVLTITFDPANAHTAVLKLWNGSTHRGRLVETDLTFALAPGGPTVKVKIAHVTSITRPYAFRDPDTPKKVEKLIAQLAAKSYKDRKAATKELVKMGKGIAPLLKEHLNNPNTEVRQRIESILEQLGVKK